MHVKIMQFQSIAGACRDSDFSIVTLKKLIFHASFLIMIVAITHKVTPYNMLQAQQHIELTIPRSHRFQCYLRSDMKQLSYSF
jgi:hypothetical protein